jgi:hypothetical protein
LEGVPRFERGLKDSKSFVLTITLHPRGIFLVPRAGFEPASLRVSF